MWIRSGHRAHGLDTHIYIYLHVYFSGIHILLHDSATFWYSLIPCIVYMFLCSGLVKYILTRRRGSKSFNMDHLRRSGLTDSELPGKFVGNHADMFSNALAFLETLLLRGMSVP